jgi:hypothetical protein
VAIEAQTHGWGTLIRVTGDYGHGSTGNANSTAIREAVWEAVEELGAGKVVLDLSGMVYEWGDAIGQVFLTHLDDNVHFVLSRECEPGWRGLLHMLDPVCGEGLQDRIRFDAPT